MHILPVITKFRQRKKVNLIGHTEINFTSQKDQRKRSIWRKLQFGMILVIITLLVSFFVRDNIEHFYVRASSLGDRLTNVSSAKYALNNITTFSTVPTQALGSGLSFISPRAYILDEYFRANRSPLYGTGKLFVEACDKYGAPKDCITVAAIARAETDLCKYLDSASYYNCWGFGGGGVHRMRFGSWAESIDLVTDRLMNSYGPEYMINPSLMEKTFCGSEPGCTNWGSRVKFHIKAIDDFSRSLGFGYGLLDLR